MSDNSAEHKMEADSIRARIAELEREVARLKESVAAHEEIDGRVDAVFADLHVENARLRAENERLRRASAELARQIEISGGIDDQGHEMKNLQALRILRALLADTGEGKTEGEEYDSDAIRATADRLLPHSMKLAAKVSSAGEEKS
jgi:chromosome segregation ATPase